MEFSNSEIFVPTAPFRQLLRIEFLRNFELNSSVAPHPDNPPLNTANTVVTAYLLHSHCFRYIMISSHLQIHCHPVVLQLHCEEGREQRGKLEELEFVHFARLHSAYVQHFGCLSPKSLRIALRWINPGFFRKQRFKC